MQHIHKPTEVEAVQVTTDSMQVDLQTFIGEDSKVRIEAARGCFVLYNEKDERNVCIGDYLIKGVLGKVYPCSAEVFEESYEVKE